MFQNMKVDIIYYKTNTDFEMEFNLCGCCRMRLLTDKTPDRKTMVHSLARAVSRSQIILIVGPLFSGSGSIASIAEAIGSKLTTLDNKTYGIKSNDEINILDTATPLVTPDGIFGGCIIESGPQTMIILSENKAIRKAIMQNLIYPYIEEFYANLLREKVNPTTDTNQDNPYSVDSASDDIICEPEDDDIAEYSFLSTDTSPEEETSYDTSEELITDSDDDSEEETMPEDSSFITEITEDDAPEIEATETDEILTDITETEPIDENEDVLGDQIILTQTPDEDVEEIQPENEDISFITDDNDEYDADETSEDIGSFGQDDGFVSETETETFRPKKYSLNLPILILTVVLLLTIAILCYCIFFIPSSSGETPAIFIKETFDTLFS